jgi:multiple sugar transport system permease protein
MNKSLLKRSLSLFGCYLAAAVVLLIFILPIYYIFTLALKTQVDAFSYPPKWIFIPTFINFSSLFAEENFAKYLTNSFIVSICCVSAGLCISAPAAYALSRLKSKWSSAALFFILAVRMIPPMSLLLPVFSLYVRLRLVDTYFGIILLYLTFVIPLDVWMLKTFFDDVPHELEEAAVIDGCGTWQVFLNVAIPLVAQALAATAIFSWILSWNEFLFAMIITREGVKTAPVAVNNFMRFEDIKWGVIAAAAVVISSPVILFSLTVRKYLISGLTAGAVKG